MKLTKELLANAFALSSGILWVFCSAFTLFFPRFSLTVTRWWFHGIKVEQLGQFNLTLFNFIMGGVALAISFWVAGYIFGWSLEHLKRKK